VTLTDEYRKLTTRMIEEGVGSEEELEAIKHGYHDFATREDFKLINKALKAKFRVEMPLDREVYHFFDFFEEIPKALNAKIIVETGTGAGGSCDRLVSAAKETGGWVYSVDNYPDHISVEQTKERHLSQEHPVTFIIGDSIETGLKWDKGDIDVLYLDSGHGFEFVSKELEVWGQYSPRIILVHDTLEADAGTQGTPVMPLTIQGPYWACKLYSERHGRSFVHVGCCFTGLGAIL